MGSKSQDQVWFVRIDNWHPTKLNQLLNAHWRNRSRRKSADAAIVRASLLDADVTPADRPRRVSLEIILGPRQRAGDPDAYWKSLLDALVKGGALVDDSRQWCELGPVTFTRGTRAATVIRLDNMKQPPDQHSEPLGRTAKPKKIHMAKDILARAERDVERKALRG